MEREWWVLVRYDKEDKPIEYWTRNSQYMPEPDPVSRVEVFDGPYASGKTAAQVAFGKNDEIVASR